MLELSAFGMIGAALLNIMQTRLMSVIVQALMNSKIYRAALLASFMLAALACSSQKHLASMDQSSQQLSQSTISMEQNSRTLVEELRKDREHLSQIAQEMKTMARTMAVFEKVGTQVAQLLVRPATSEPQVAKSENQSDKPSDEKAKQDNGEHEVPTMQEMFGGAPYSELGMEN